MRAGTYRAPNKEQQKKNRAAPAAVQGGANIMLVGDGDEEEGLLDEYEGVGFIQKELDEPMVVEVRATLSEDRLYLDTCSSFHMCFNAKYLAKVQRLMMQLKGDCNAGTTGSREKGWLASIFHMWLVRNGIVNVLSVGQLEKDGFKISYETGGDWVVRTPNGKSLKFKRDTGMCYGFPYLDLRETHDLEGLACVQTMRENMEGFTKRELKRAILARQKQQQVGIPSEAEFAKMVSGNHVKNAPFTVQDISNARAIYGPLLDIPLIL